MINSERLEAFFVVATEGTVSNASKVLGISQPAVTHRMKKLEDELGESLFFHKGKGLELTEKGMKLLQYCEQRKLWEAVVEMVEAHLSSKFY